MTPSTMLNAIWLLKNGIGILQLGGCDQGNELVQKDEEADGKNDIDGSHPAADLGLLGSLFFVGRNRVERDVGGVAQRAEAQHHRLARAS